MRRRLLAIALVAVPFALLGLDALTWLQLGVDFPIWDDWRTLLSGGAGTFELGYLLRAENDTLYPLGKALDATAQRLLGGNTVAYQTISMIAVLGSVLLLQGYLLRKALGPTLLAAAVFALTAVSVSTWIYWGDASLGYHQAVPIVCLLAILALYASGRGGARTLVLGGLVLGLAAGFIYVSGAVAMVVVGASLLLLALLPGTTGRHGFRRLAWLGGSVVAAGAFTTTLQFMALVVLRPAAWPRAELAQPFQLDFWLFVLGIVADALLLDPRRPFISGAIAAIAVAVLVGLGATLLYRLLRRRTSHREMLLAVLFLTIALTVGASLLLVTMGRLELSRAGTSGEFDPFVAGFRRFYQWWPTILWPWAGAAILLLVGRFWRGRRTTRALEAIAVLGAVTVISLGFARGTFDFGSNFQTSTDQRLATAACVEWALVDDDADCSFSRWDQDRLVEATLRGARIGASFVATLDPAPSTSARDILYEASTVTSGPSGVVTITTAAPNEMGVCQVLELAVGTVRSGADLEVAKLDVDYFRVDRPRWRSLDDRLAQPWQEPVRSPIILSSDQAGEARATLLLLSLDGLQDEVRVSVPGSSAVFTLADVVLDCRRSFE